MSSFGKECGFVEAFICFKKNNSSMVFRHDQVLGTFLQSTQPVITKSTITTCGTMGPPIGLFPLTDSSHFFSFSNSFVVVKLLIKMPLQHVTSMYFMVTSKVSKFYVKRNLNSHITGDLFCLHFVLAT